MQPHTPHAAVAGAAARNNPFQPPFYSGSGNSAFFPCSDQDFRIGVELIKKKRAGDGAGEEVVRAFRL